MEEPIEITSVNQLPKSGEFYGFTEDSYNKYKGDKTHVYRLTHSFPKPYVEYYVAIQEEK